MALRLQQLALAVEPTGIAAEGAVTADHPVARDQHCDVVVAIGRADGPDCTGLADGGGDLRIAARFTRRDLAKLPPDGFLKGGAGNVDRQFPSGERLFDGSDGAFDQILKAARVVDDGRVREAATRRIRAVVA